MKKVLLFTFLFAGLTAGAYAQNVLSQAEDLYRQGKFAQALGLYEQELKTHPNDPFVYYNIGNCYFKMGSKGLAAANYYRAFRQAPRDTDIRHNLSLTLANSGEKWVPAGIPVVLHRAFYSLSLAELAGLVSLLFWGACCWLSIWLLSRKGGKFLLVWLGVLALCAGWWQVRQKQENQPLAVIAAPVAEIRSGPGTNFPASASVTQGHLLVIEDVKDAWYEVIVKSQSLKGWVEKSAVEKI